MHRKSHTRGEETRRLLRDKKKKGREERGHVKKEGRDPKEDVRSEGEPAELLLRGSEPPAPTISLKMSPQTDSLLPSKGRAQFFFP